MKPTRVPQEVEKAAAPSCHPEEAQKNFVWNKILLKWLNPLIQLAYQGPLEESDVWPVADTDMSVQHHAAVFSAAWAAECAVAREKGGAAPSLRNTLLHIYRRDVIVGGLYQFQFMLLQLLQPFIIGRLLGYISSDREDNGGGGVGTGLMWALLLAVVAFLSSNALVLAFSNNRRFGTFVRAALMMSIYEHSMKITNASRMKNDIGTTTNLMAIDSEKVFFSVQFLHFLWHGPVTIVVVMGLLLTQVGALPALVGLAVVLLTIPVQRQCALLIGALRRQMVRVTDSRVALISEVLQVIRAVKLYAWEDMLFERVAALRALEVHSMWAYLVSSAAMRDVNQLSPVITAVLMFTMLVFVVYSSRDEEGTDSSDSSRLTTTDAVTILAYLNIIRFPLQLLGVALKTIVDGTVSLHRLNNFLLLEVLPVRESDNADDAACDTNAAIVFSNASFSWSPPDDGDGDITAQSLHTDSRDNDHIPQQYDSEKKSGLADSTSQQQLYSQLGSIPAAAVMSPLQVDHSSASLTALDLSIGRGELVAIIGSVGSGKSNFIAAILGEMPCTEGRVSVYSDRVAYSAQTPWIQNMTVRENILFGARLERNQDLDPAAGGGGGSAVSEELYRMCLHQAALSTDLENLPHGDLTEIGERGINLSGGQKSRVSFCRALLAASTPCQHGTTPDSNGDSSIVILDDPFSSVDGQTGNLMFQRGVLGGLHGKTRLLALNSHLHLLPHFDRVAVLHEGRLELLASPQELFSTHRNLYERVLGSLQGHQHESEEQSSNGEDTFLEEVKLEEVREEITNDMSERSCEELEAELKLVSINGKSGEEFDVEELDASPSSSSSSHEQNGKSSDKKDEGLISTETKDTHSVSIYTYFAYFGAAFWTDDITPQLAKKLTVRSVVACISILLAFFMAQLARVLCDVVLLQWVSEHEAEPDSGYYRLYLVCVAVFVLLTGLRSCFLSLYATAICKSIHNMLFRKILNAPVPDFFDVTMVGNILNRFAKDMETTDVTIPEFLNMFLFQFFTLFSVVGLCVWSVPMFSLLVIPIVVFVLRMFLLYAPFSRDIKRLESMSRTPVYSSFSETLTGLETIRAYGDTKRFLAEHLSRMNQNHKLFYHMTMGQSWLTVRMELSGVSFLASIGILSVLVKELTVVSEAKVGLAMVYTLQLTAMFQRCVQLAMDLQTHFTSVERIVHFIEIPQESSTIVVPPTEAALHTDEQSYHDSEDKGEFSDVEMGVGDGVSLTTRGCGVDLAQRAGIGGGTITFSDVWMRYRANTPFVLKGVSFHVQQGERVGICGRTGAGKSSILQALFRVVEAHSGTVSLCGIDTRQIPLHQLRSMLAIIPQDPVLLKGCIRFQLDPFDMFSDEEVWGVLEKTGLAAAVRAMAGKLQEPVAEGGENLSQGEKQLLCIARALLRRAQVLVLDEATSACDPATDQSIQLALQAESREHGATVLTIAHRLHTILDCHKILVLRQGTVAEYAAPAELLADPASEFSQMLSDYNSSHR